VPALLNAALQRVAKNRLMVAANSNDKEARMNKQQALVDACDRRHQPGSERMRANGSQN
jgi:hypothetical protein